MRALLGALTLALMLTSGCARPLQTREAEDARDVRRRCEPAVATPPLTDSSAIACAEWFVRTQGYTLARPHADTARIVPEGIEFGSAPSDWLAQRRGSLEPFARLLCRTDGADVVLVAFASVRDSTDLRVVTMTVAGHSLRVQHSSLHPDVPTDPAFGCRVPARPDGAT